MSNLVLGIILGLWNGISMVLSLSGTGVRTTLITGVIAGLCTGDITKGFEVGATCMLMSIGFYTYGGATIPDYITGTCFGTVFANKAGGDVETAIAFSSGIALLMSQMDILGRATTTVFQHWAEAELAKNNIKKFELATVLGVLPWVLSRAIPTFLGMLLVDQMTKIEEFASNIQAVQNGLSVVGGILPAVGFALLLSYMDLGKYWPFLIIGFVLYAYAGMGTLALALVGLAAAAFFVKGGAQ